ncbi:DNA recombination protein RmuC [Ferrovibrio sp. MS7]|uniref:DNA recombination protein RmuC n=1 Tax=Ferrovibrio plantarum TaxID=3119164 RepID=UPI00313621F7
MDNALILAIPLLVLILGGIVLLYLRVNRGQGPDLAGPLQARLEQALADRAAALEQARLHGIEVEKAMAARDAAIAAKELELGRRVEAEREAALARQKLVDFEQLKQQMTEAAKAATLESGKQLSGQLLEQHKREAEAAKQQQEAAIKQTTEALTQRLEQVSAGQVASVAQLNQTQITVATIHRAISHPGGAGRMAEIGLENLLKSFGLEPGVDFIVQYHVAGDGERGTQRPDAVVFLPGDAALVIDSKASKTLLDLAEAETQAAAEDALARFAQRMNQHLRSLSSKEYGKGVLDQYKTLGRGGSLSRTIIAMALPNDAAVEKLRQADPTLERLAAEKDIVIAGPSALAAIISMARVNIFAGRQSENQEQIVEAVRLLIDGLVTALGAAEKSAKGFATAAEQLEAFTRSVNSRLLPRVRRLAQLGIRPSKQPPQALPGVQVTVQQGDAIDAEAEEILPPRIGKPE